MLVVLCAVQFGNVVVASEALDQGGSKAATDGLGVVGLLVGEDEEKGAAAGATASRNSDVYFDARDRKALQWFLSLTNEKSLKENLGGAIVASNQRAEALDAAQAAIDYPGAHHFFPPVREFLTKIMEQQQQPLDDQAFMGEIYQVIEQSEQQDRDCKARNEATLKQKERAVEQMEATLEAWEQSDKRALAHIAAGDEIIKNIKKLDSVDQDNGLGMVLVKGVFVIVVVVGLLWYAVDRTSSSNARV